MIYLYENGNIGFDYRIINKQQQPYNINIIEKLKNKDGVLISFIDLINTYYDNYKTAFNYINNLEFIMIK